MYDTAAAVVLCALSHVDDSSSNVGAYLMASPLPTHYVKARHFTYVRYLVLVQNYCCT